MEEQQLSEYSFLIAATPLPFAPNLNSTKASQGIWTVSRPRKEGPRPLADFSRRTTLPQVARTSSYLMDARGVISRTERAALMAGSAPLLAASFRVSRTAQRRNSTTKARHEASG